MSDMVDRLEALQTIRAGLEETCAHLTTQLFAAERRWKEAEAAGAALIDPLFALGVELQRLRERVAELERETGYSDQRLVDIYDRATKAEVERDAALAQVAVLREALMVADGAMNSMGDTLNDMDVAGEMGDFEKVAAAFEVVRTALAATPAPDILRRVAERVREACARTLFTCSSHTLEEAIEAKLPCAHQRQMTCIRAVDVDAIIKEATCG